MYLLPSDQISDPQSDMRFVCTTRKSSQVAELPAGHRGEHAWTTIDDDTI